MVAAAPLSSVLLGDVDRQQYVRLAAVVIPLLGPARVATSWFRLQRKAWTAARFAVATTVINAIAGFLFVVVMDLGVAGVFLAQIAAGVLSTAATYWLLRGWLHLRHFDASRLRVMLAFAGPLIPAAVSLWVVNLLDRYFIDAFAGKTELGLYQVGYQLSAGVAFVVGAFKQAWGPFAFSMMLREGAERVYAAALPAYVWVASWFCLFVTFAAPELTRWLTTTAYAGAATVVAPIAFSHLLTGLVPILGLGALIAKKTWPMAAGVTVAAALTIVLNLVLTPRFGRQGAAFSTLIAWAVVPMFVLRRSQRLHPIAFSLREPALILAAAGAFAAAGSGVVFGDVSLLGRLLLLVGFTPTVLLLRPAARTLRNLNVGEFSGSAT